MQSEPRSAAAQHARVSQVRERLLDLVSCAGRPALWESIAAKVAQPKDLPLLRSLALDDAESWNVRALAARMYARIADVASAAQDPVLTHASATLREEAMMGAADRGSRVLLQHFASDTVSDIAECAREYLDDLPA